jgi:D-alanyl-D-alanine carboxypeptidase
MTGFGVGSIVGRAIIGVAAMLSIGAVSAKATPYLVVDADSGQVLVQNEATAPWFPASLTKLMTVYVALDAVRNGKLTLDTPLVLSVRAARMPPSKMGFRPGTEVTLDNALKMLMVPYCCDTLKVSPTQAKLEWATTSVAHPATANRG